MTNKASIYLTCVAVSVGHVSIPVLAMSCSAPLLGVPHWRCHAMPWGLGMWEQLRPRGGVSCGVSLRPSASHWRLFHMLRRSTEVCSFLSRPDQRQKQGNWLLFLPLCAATSVPPLERRAAGRDLSLGVLLRRAEGMKEAVEK